MRLYLLVVLSALSVLAGDEDSKLRTAQSRRLLVQGEHLKTDDRIELLAKAAKVDPTDLQIQLSLARAYIQKLRENGDALYLSRAAQLVDAVLASQPRHHEARRLRNEIEMNLHHFSNVAKYAEDLLAEFPGDASTLGLLGDALMELGNYDRAGEMYQRMTSVGGNLFSYNRLAYYHFVTGDAQTAINWMAQGIAAGSRAPENLAWCLSEMGDMLFKMGKLADANYAYEYSLRIFPGYYRAHAGLGRVQSAMGNWKDAINSFQRAQAILPLPEYAASLQALYDLKGDRENSKRQTALLQAVDVITSSNGGKANRTIAIIYADAGCNLARALEMANAEFQDRNDVYSYDALSWVLYKNNRLPEAVVASEQALKLQTPEPNFYFHAGLIALAAGDSNAAKRHLERALSFNPQFDIRNAPIARTTLRSLESEHGAGQPPLITKNQ